MPRAATVGTFGSVGLMSAERPAPLMPLVSIGIPTFNRADQLARALRSALEQTYARLEIVVADNASTDGTPELCAALAHADDRLRVLRRPQNIGATANFNGVVEASRGGFVLLLADDDWLAPDYVERCVSELRARPELALVCGRALYFRGDSVVYAGKEVRVLDAQPARRIARYFRLVRENATFYGVMRADVARSVFPLESCIGADWLLLGRVAALGGIETLTTTTLSRSLDGASAGLDTIAANAGVTPALQGHAHLVIGWHIMRAVGWSSPAYAALGGARRLAVASASALPVVGHWMFYRYGRVLAHPLTRRAQPVTRLRRASAALLPRRRPQR